jgi:hypothetical protein
VRRQYEKPVARDLASLAYSASGQSIPPFPPGGPGDSTDGPLGGDSLLACSSGNNVTWCVPLGGANANGACNVGNGVFQVGPPACAPGSLATDCAALGNYARTT